MAENELKLTRQKYIIVPADHPLTDDRLLQKEEIATGQSGKIELFESSFDYEIAQDGSNIKISNVIIRPGHSAVIIGDETYSKPEELENKEFTLNQEKGQIAEIVSIASSNGVGWY